ncbi:MAG: type II 3-dehydroquinate dehydratase [Bacteroidales bacterium]|nr:type II 3-dehydroquinate dehydratase [Bacteroidales bacterium]
MKEISIINGPNLNILGQREVSIYGTETFEDYLAKLKKKFPEINISYFQSNVEGEIVTQIQKDSNKDGIIINAGAYTHTSIAIADAISAIKAPVIEVHISNILAREEYRHKSFLSPVCKGSLFGFGLKGYELALYVFQSEN